MWARLVQLVFGAWLMASPDLLGYGNPAETNDRIIGPIIITVSIIAIDGVMRPLRWVNLALGAWLLIAPFALAYESTEATLNSIVVGIGVAALSFIRGEITQRYGGGWSVLFTSWSENKEEDHGWK